MRTPDWDIFRSHFPALENRIYLNTAGGGAMSVFSADAGRRYYSESEEFGDTCWDTWIDRMESIRRKTAKFVGAEPEDVAFIQHTSLGINIIAHQFTEPVRVLAIDKEFPSCTTPWVSAGHSVSFLETPPDGTVTAEQLKESLGAAIDIFVLSSVQFANGFRADIREMGRICRERGVLFVVDATQSICAYEMDVKQDCIDVLVFSGYKWATSGYGIAAIVIEKAVRNRATGLVGWRSARHPYLLENDRLDITESAVRHEMGHPAFPGIFSMGAAIDLFSKVGVRSVSRRIDDLSEHLRSGIAAAGWNLRSCARQESASGITLIETDNAEALASALREKLIWVSPRAGGIRVSVHAYNTMTEVDEFCAALSSLRQLAVR